jgi:hypothetical protein
VTSGAKALKAAASSARLKSCPDTKHLHHLRHDQNHTPIQSSCRIFGTTKSCPDTKHLPQRLKPLELKVLVYGLKPVPFKLNG